MQLNHCQSYNGVQALGSTIEVMNVQGFQMALRFIMFAKWGRGEIETINTCKLQIVKNARALLLIQSGCLYEGGNCHVGDHLGFIFVAFWLSFVVDVREG
jgi:hypothetical protein